MRYDLPRPASPPRYEHWASERNNWTIEGSPRQVRVADRHKVVNGTATGGEELDHGKRTGIFSNKNSKYAGCPLTFSVIR